MCFVGFSEDIKIMSLHRINWLVFTAELESVHCAVRAESLNIIRVIVTP